MTRNALALALALAGVVATFGSATITQAKSPVAGNYLVTFAEPPLAAFQGFAGDSDPQKAALKATSPAVTGERHLDVRSAAAKAYRSWLAERRDEHLRDISAALGRRVDPSLSLDVVNNLAVLHLSAAEAAQVAALAGIALVEPEFMRAPMTDAGPQWIGASQVWTGANGLASRGEGVVVGVIDSGINRTHPAFAAVGPVDGYVHTNPRGQVFGLCIANPTFCNAKLIGIHDFTICTGVHNSTDCSDLEANVGLNQDGHGSHVSATAVGNLLNTNPPFSGGGVSPRLVSGVAPHANIIHYKACEDVEDCRGSWVLAAINEAVTDRVAVINYSIGADARDPWNTSDSIAMLNAREAGIVVVAAAGNSGPGASTVSAPSNAPWVIAAANSSHDRAVLNRLVDLTGGNSAPPQGGVLLGQGSTAGYGPASIVVPLDFPGCSMGSNQDSPPTGVSNPFLGRVFNGEIVVCARGTQARVAKSNNVRLAGGGGMILTNTALEGEGTVADALSIPATHIGFQAGSELRQWLASGSGHRGRLEGGQIGSLATVADILNSSSSRGPGSVEGVLKPNISAPGSSILAAAGEGNGFAFFSGTSMATPHIAGAVALLRALRPNWTASDIESALVTTARPVVKSSDGLRVATPFEQGNGRVSVADALRVGLSFPVSAAEFRAARPSLGGQPATLNQAAVVDAQCFERCSFRRQVRDLVGGGRWRVEAELPAGARAVVTPAEFDLVAGGTQSLDIELIVDSPLLAGQWVSGGLNLRRVSGPPAADARITAHVFSAPGALPATINLSSAAERGVSNVSLSSLIALPDLTLGVTALTTPTRRVETVVQDPTSEVIYDAFGPGTLVSLVNVPGSNAPAGFRLLAELVSTTAPDVDLFVGEDFDGDGLPEEIEEVCTSNSAGPSERCDVSVAASSAARRYWVLAQSYRASPGGGDSLRLSTTLVEMKADPASALTVTAPASIARLENVPLRFAVDAPSSVGGEVLRGFVSLSAVAEAAQPFAWVLVDIERGNAPLAERALMAGRALDLRLPAAAAAERLFIDVPANASTLTIRSTGSGEVDLYAARVASPTTPVIAAAPARAAAQASAVGPGANHTLTVTGAILQPGRWYLTPVNTGTADSIVTLTAELSYTTPRAQPRFGAYFDPNRDGSGVFLFPVGSSWGLAWYTYLEDGTPTWYLGAAAQPSASQGHWQIDLLRYRWNGSEAIGTRVGEATLSLNEQQSFTYSWSLDSSSGSQKLQWIGDTRCPLVAGSPLDVTGLWFSPTRPGFGYSVIASPDFESIAAYFYDQQGVARWSLGTAAVFGSGAVGLDWRVGVCPLCDFRAPTVQPRLGSLQRSYSSASVGRFAVDFPLPAPLSGRWQMDLPAARLSDAIGCP